MLKIYTIKNKIQHKDHGRHNQVLLNLTALQYSRALQHSSIAPQHESDSRPRHAAVKPLSETKANGKCDGRRYSRVPLCHIPQGGTGGLLLPTSQNIFPSFSNPLFSRLSASKFGTSQNPISQFESHFPHLEIIFLTLL